MAVSRMSKVLLMYDASKEDEILTSLQSLQLMEVMDAKENLDAKRNKQLEDLAFDKRLLERDLSNQSLLKRIEKTTEFLIRNASKKVPSWNTTDASFLTFDQSLQFDELMQTITTIEDLRNKKEGFKKDLEYYNDELERLERLKQLPYVPSRFESIPNVSYILGNVAVAMKGELESALEAFHEIIVYTLYEDPSQITYAFIVHGEEKTSFKEVLKKISFEEEFYVYDVLPVEQKKAYETLISRILESSKELQEQIDARVSDVMYLQQCEEVLLSRMESEEVQQKTLENEKGYIVMRGWVPSDQKEKIEKSIQALSSEDSSILVEFDDEVKDQDDVPIQLKNNRLVKPFESITGMYSLPKYNEIDPTPYMTPFYMVFFGMMVADMGYGAFMFIALTLAMKFVNLRKSTKDFLGFFRVLSVPTFIWGVIYGSFFGADTGYAILSTTNDMTTILLMSVVFGFIQICTGLFIGGVEKVKVKDIYGSIGDSFAWFTLMLGIGLLVVDMMVLHTGYLQTIALGICIVSLLAILIVPALIRKSKIKGLMVGLYNVYGITGYIGDLVSYTRLMALGIAGGSIGSAFNMLVSFLPVPARFSIGILLIVFLHVFNLFLSLLSAYVHGARLQYVEFFGKFYEGGGRKFTPFKPKEKYVDFQVDRQKGGSK